MLCYRVVVTVCRSCLVILIEDEFKLARDMMTYRAIFASGRVISDIK